MVSNINRVDNDNLRKSKSRTMDLRKSRNTGKLNLRLSRLTAPHGLTDEGCWMRTPVGAGYNILLQEGLLVGNRRRRGAGRSGDAKLCMVDAVVAVA